MKKKSLIALCCTFALASTITIPCSAITVNGYTYNDLNDDGAYDSTDVMIINQYLHGTYDYTGSLSELDVTGNYIIDIVDATAYLRYYVTEIM